MTGDHGDVLPSQPSTPATVKNITTDSTATGRRFGCRSPLLPTNGINTSTSPMIPGMPKIAGVSSDGGNSASNPNSGRKYQSGRGSAVMIVGSGGSPGPFGPITAASATITSTVSAEKIMSRRTGFG